MSDGIRQLMSLLKSTRTSRLRIGTLRRLNASSTSAENGLSTCIDRQVQSASRPPRGLRNDRPLRIGDDALDRLARVQQHHVAPPAQHTPIFAAQPIEVLVRRLALPCPQHVSGCVEDEPQGGLRNPRREQAGEGARSRHPVTTWIHQHIVEVRIRNQQRAPCKVRTHAQPVAYPVIRREHHELDGCAQSTSRLSRRVGCAWRSRTHHVRPQVALTARDRRARAAEPRAPRSPLDALQRRDLGWRSASRADGSSFEASAAVRHASLPATERCETRALSTRRCAPPARAPTDPRRRRAVITPPSRPTSQKRATCSAAPSGSRRHCRARCLAVPVRQLVAVDAREQTPHEFLGGGRYEDLALRLRQVARADAIAQQLSGGPQAPAIAQVVAAHFQSQERRSAIISSSN